MSSHVLSFAALLMFMPSVARAGKGEQTATVSLSMIHIDPGKVAGMVDSRAGFGASLGVDYDYGVSDSSGLRASMNGGAWFAPDGKAWAGSAIAGIVLEPFEASGYVPYGTIGGGVLFSRGGGVENILVPVVEAGVGLDIAAADNASWGVFFRMQLAAHNESVIFIGVRGSHRFSAPR